MLLPIAKILMLIFSFFVLSGCHKSITQSVTIQQPTNTARTKAHINEVTRTQIATDITGVGKVYSDKIVNNRDTFGPFASAEDFEKRMFEELGDKTIYKVLQEYDFSGGSYDFKNGRTTNTARNTDISDIQR